MSDVMHREWRFYLDDMVNQRAYREIEDSVQAQEVTGLDLKGVNRPQGVYSISKSTKATA